MIKYIVPMMREVKQHVVKWSCSAVRLGNDDIPAIMGGHLEGEIR